VIHFSPQFVSLISPQTPELKFTAASREEPEPAQFVIAVNDKGEVRHCFLKSSSGDAALDEQARKYIAASRVPAVRNSPDSTAGSLTWGEASVEWGNDIAIPAASPAPPTTP
jgi:hypothetical protein